MKEGLLLGDLIDKTLEVTGIKSVVGMVSKATNTDCGCKERTEQLNNLHYQGKQYLNSYERRLLRQQQKTNFN
jgi:hypothetical protein